MFLAPTSLTNAKPCAKAKVQAANMYPQAPGAMTDIKLA
jgi:hypothetical protein